MAYHPYDRRPTYSTDHSQSYTYHRPQLELPRPLEPRPTLQTSLSESSTTHRRQDAFNSPVDTDARAQSHNLPGLRDILTNPAPRPPSPPRTAWGGSVRPSHYFQHNDGGHPQRYEFHPPMALQQPADHSVGYHAQQGRPFEVPILETNPVTRNPSHVGSPYTSFPEQARDRSERYFEAPTGSYTANGNISPYAATGAQDVPYQSPGGTFNRAPGSPYVPPGADSQKKYLGVKEVPGEGSYHLYEGGYRIPTHVDGEQVNPAWGLTKANKPRKRLALACLDCREKKIKCEPGATSCLQCEKAKRTCRRWVCLSGVAIIANISIELLHSFHTVRPHRPLGKSLATLPFARAPRFLILIL